MTDPNKLIHGLACLILKRFVAILSECGKAESVAFNHRMRFERLLLLAMEKIVRDARPEQTDLNFRLIGYVSIFRPDTPDPIRPVTLRNVLRQNVRDRLMLDSAPSCRTNYGLTPDGEMLAAEIEDYLGRAVVNEIDQVLRKWHDVTPIKLLPALYESTAATFYGLRAKAWEECLDLHGVPVQRYFSTYRRKYHQVAT